MRETQKMRVRETHLGENGERVDPASWIGCKSLSSKNRTTRRLCCCNKENNNGVGDGFRCGFGRGFGGGD